MITPVYYNVNKHFQILIKASLTYLDLPSLGNVKILNLFFFLFSNCWHIYYLVSIYLFKLNNGNNRTMCEILSKLTIKKPERRLRCRYCKRWTNLTHCSSIPIAFFQEIDAVWIICSINRKCFSSAWQEMYPFFFFIRTVL